MRVREVRLTRYRRSPEVPIRIVACLMLASCIACVENSRDQESGSAMITLPAQLAGWTLQDSSVTYDRETIFDYINGAGEVYRSYAFSEVVVGRYAREGESDVLVELFDMGTPGDAYGVFSYAREEEDEGIGGGYEHKGDVLCFWQNRYYLCLALDDPSLGSDTSLTRMAAAVSELLPPSSVRPGLVAMLPDEGLVVGSERFFHLHQSLNYHYYLARENLLDLNPDTDVVFARYEPGATFLLIARYHSEGAARDALTSFRSGYIPDAGEAETHETENGKFVACRQAGQHVVVILDAESERSALSLLRDATERVSSPTD